MADILFRFDVDAPVETVLAALKTSDASEGSDDASEV